MKFFTLEKFDNDELKDFSDFINKYPDKEPLHIFLDSEGGETMIGDALISLINSYPEKFSISVLVASSAAFTLLLNVNCEVEVLKNAYCMTHKWWWNVHMRDGNTAHWEFSDFQREQLKEHWEDISYLTLEEKIKHDQWLDIFFNQKRTIEIMCWLNKIYQSDKNIFNPREYEKDISNSWPTLNSSVEKESEKK